MKLNIFTILLVLSFVFSLTESVFACQCYITQPACSAYWQADAVFVGNVDRIEQKEEDEPKTVFFNIEKNYRGIKEKTIQIEDPANSCQFGFETGRKYLVYAYKSEDGKTYSTSQCTRTQPFKEQLPDFSFLDFLNDSKPEFMIRGTILLQKIGYYPLRGVNVDVSGENEKFKGTSDEFGDIKILVTKEGKYNVRIWLPRNSFIVGTNEQIEAVSRQGKIGKRHYIEYDAVVKPDNCYWFNLQLWQPDYPKN